MSCSNDDVENVFPKQAGAEIESSLRTMKDLPENRRGQLNSHVSGLIQEKRTALTKIKDKPGNEAAYFLIGLLFVWDLVRIGMCGTGEERMTSATVHFQTPEGEMLMGYGSIAKYFFETYKSVGGSDPGYLHIIKKFGL